jgi:osmoprotectant transport system permease protein
MGHSLEQEEGPVVIDFLGDVITYLVDPANWSGPRGLGTRVWQHVAISVASLGFAGVLALPPAVLLGHARRGGFFAVSAVNLGRAIPSFGIVGVMFPITLSIAVLASPIGYWATFIALVLLAMPPMFVNTYTGVSGIDDDLLEAARGMGMTERDVLLRIEIPLSMPLTMAGIRTAAVAVIATATLGAVVGFGGLGRPIIDGFAQGNDVLVFVGGLLVAILAILAELGLGWVERRTDPSRRGSRRDVGVLAPTEVADRSF